MGQRINCGGDNCSMKTIDLEIKDYGKIILRKLGYMEKCNLQDKMVKVTIETDKLGNPKEEREVSVGKLSFWLVVYSIKTMPNYPEFWKLDESKKADIVSHFGEGDNDPENLGELIFQKAQDFNKFMPTEELKKK